MSTAEWVGYAASAVVMASFLLGDMKRLRIVNTMGCLLFVAYGALLKEWPIIITNVFIVLVNAYYLFVKKN